MTVIAGCGASSSASPPATLPPAPTPPLLATAVPPRSVTALPTTARAATPTVGRTATPVNMSTVEAVANGFSAALMRHDNSLASSYLSAPLQARVPPQGLKRALGLPRFPTSFQYAITSSGPSRATMNLVYQYAGGTTSDITTVVRTSSGWRISAIHPG